MNKLFYFLLIGVIGLSAAPEVSFKETITRNGKEYVYSPRYQYPDLPRKFHSNDLFFYQRNPGETYINSVPLEEECLHSLKKFTVPDNVCNFFFMVHAPIANQIKKLQLGTLVNKKGETIDSSTWQYYYAEQHIRLRTPGSQAYHIIPEILKDFEAKELASGHNLIILIQGNPANCPSGSYQGELNVVSSQSEQKIPVQLQVLPIRLILPENIQYLMYANVISQPKEKRVQFVREIADFGINGIVHHMGIQGEDNIREFWDTIKDAGMQAKVNVLDFGPVLVHRSVREATGHFPKNPQAACYEECYEPAVMGQFMNNLSDLDRWMRKYSQEDSRWFYQGWDEPYLTSKVAQALWETSLVRQAGLASTSTVYDYDGMVEMASRGLQVSINGTALYNLETYQRLTKLATQLRISLWYLGAGSYQPQQGILGVNRYQAGFLFFKSGFPKHVSWTYNWEQDEFASFNRFIYAMAYKRPKEEKRATFSTLQLEGLREGITDYKFAATLRQKIAEAQAKNQNEAAKHANDKLNWILQELVVWKSEAIFAYDHFAKRNMDHAKLENLRWLIAKEILTLMEL